MEISINRPSITIALNIADSEPIELKLYTDTPKVYKAVAEAWRDLEAIQRERLALPSKGLSQAELALQTCRCLEHEAKASIIAIQEALGSEFSKIESIISYLPVSALSDILTAIARGMSEAMIESLAKGKI